MERETSDTVWFSVRKKCLGQREEKRWSPPSLPADPSCWSFLSLQVPIVSPDFTHKDTSGLWAQVINASWFQTLLYCAFILCCVPHWYNSRVCTAYRNSGTSSGDHVQGQEEEGTAVHGLKVEPGMFSKKWVVSIKPPRACKNLQTFFLATSSGFV